MSIGVGALELMILGYSDLNRVGIDSVPVSHF